MTNDADEPQDSGKRAERKRRRNQARANKTSSGKGLAALLLILGLMIGTLFGGLVGLFSPRTGVLEGLPGTAEPTPVPTPVPTTVTRTVEVEKPVTPRDCLDALDDLTAYLDDLADSREALMRADLARVSGDEQTAAAGFAEVDRELRALILAANAQSLSSAIEDCRAQADSSNSRNSEPQETPIDAPQETPSPEPEPEVTPSPEAEDDESSPEAEDEPAADADEDPLPVPTPQSSPESTEDA